MDVGDRTVGDRAGGCITAIHPKHVPDIGKADVGNNKEVVDILKELETLIIMTYEWL
jgi:hypothetical protein